MCVSTADAEFSGTIIYAGRRHHPERGLVHVLGYQNQAVNLASGPNAMLLHVPTRSLRPDQFVDVSRDPRLLTRMSGLVHRPVSRGPGGLDWMSDDSVTVFDHDIYTVVLADKPTDIPSALSQVAPRKRPVVRPELFDFYADCFADHAVMLCCFDNADRHRASPLVVWYRPNEPDLLVMPGVDAHNGGPPSLGTPTFRDHVLVFGTDVVGPDWGNAMSYPKRLRPDSRVFLPDRVDGVGVEPQHGPLSLNGDFAITHDDLVAGRFDRVHVVASN